jgi:hypothetical protein
MRRHHALFGLCAVWPLRCLASALFGITRSSASRAVRHPAPFGLCGVWHHAPFGTMRRSAFRALRQFARFGIMRGLAFRAVLAFGALRHFAPFGISPFGI